MYSPIIPRQNICSPPKNDSRITIVGHPGVVSRKYFSNITSNVRQILPINVKKPIAVTILRGTILKDVSPFKARLISEIRVNFEVPNFLGFTSK